MVIAVKSECEGSDAASNSRPDPPHSPLWTVDKTLPAMIVCQLSTTVRSLLGEKAPRWSECGNILSRAIFDILESATFLFQSKADCHHFVARCGEHVVVKAISIADSTEYTTLQFLESNVPAVPAPRPHGVISVGDTWYMFMDYIPGVNLATAWPSLTESQKEFLSFELNTLLLRLREAPFECGKRLGGVAGQGCKDTRRFTRTAESPIYTSNELWDFMYGCARNKDTVYGKFLRKQTFPPRQQRIVLTHGDIRPANVMVHCQPGGSIRISGLIDWEMSGFYPEDIECVKALNNLSPIGNDDWYLYLPECISPRHRLESWHADLVWDPYVV